MSACGINSDLLPGAPGAGLAGRGQFRFEGYPLKAGQVVRLHCEYQNNTGAPRTT